MEPSRAPNGRINITYKLEKDAVKQEELPLRFMVVGDFTGGADQTPVRSRKPRQINRDNFDTVMAAHKLKLHLNIADTLAGGSDTQTSLQLDIKSMADFEPDSIVDQIAKQPDGRMQGLKHALALREALLALKGPMGTVEGFRKRLEEVVKDPARRAELLSRLQVAD